MRSFDLIRNALRKDGKILVCGNGGSHSDAQHIVGELMKSFLRSRPLPDRTKRSLRDQGPDGVRLAETLTGALPALALGCNTALATAIGNDQGWDTVFAQELAGVGREGDVLVAISTSGSASNVISAVRMARACGIQTVGLTGAARSPLRGLCDICISVPATGSAAVQELHILVYHALCAALERAFFSAAAAPGG
jgi:D-sedoheptulose 7-phosphate isomerase